MAIDFILGIKAGIGHNLAEAAIAADIAKNSKPNIQYLPDSVRSMIPQWIRGPVLSFLEDSPEKANQKTLDQIARNEYAIHKYDGSPINENEGINLEVQQKLDKMASLSKERLDYFLERFGVDDPAYKAFFAEIKSKMTDAKTGTLTPFGYRFQLQQNGLLIPKKGEERFTVLFDVNDMHYWNDSKNGGYNRVSEKLDLIGRALNTATRQTMNPDYPDRSLDLLIKPNGYLKRTHGDAGDEFELDLVCKPESIVSVVKRAIDFAYFSQH